MGNYLFERNTEDGAGSESGSSLPDDVKSALGEFDWVDQFALKADDGDGSVVVVDVHFDPDWPDTANPDLVADVFHRFGLRLIDNPTSPGGKVSAADPLSVGASAGDDALDLVIFDE
ncbi:MAG: hypothetical protein ABI588_01345 [Arenimonas sp.]